MPRSQNRGNMPNLKSYRNASKNMRNFVGLDGDARKILQQGIITDEKQNVHNVEQLIKYLQGDRFRRWIVNEIGNYLSDRNIDGGEGEGADTFDPSSIHSDISRIESEISRIWNIINNLPAADGENPPYPMKAQYFNADTPNGFNQHDGQAELDSDTQIILVRKVEQNANGIRFYNMNTDGGNERVLFVGISSDSPYQNNLQVIFSAGDSGSTSGLSINTGRQLANIVFLSKDYCMYQPMGSGGQIT